MVKTRKISGILVVYDMFLNLRITVIDLIIYDVYRIKDINIYIIEDIIKRKIDNNIKQKKLLINNKKIKLNFKTM